MSDFTTHPLGQAEFAEIAAIMASEARIHVATSKQTLVHSRLSRRIRDHGLSGFPDYLALVKRDAGERTAMISALTTNHTHFFREDHHFDHLREELIPAWKAQPKSEPVRIWSAGCSSGQEVYTIALCLLGKSEEEAQWVRNSDVKLLATDLAEKVVKQAQDARYPAAEVDAIPREYRRWMQRDGNDWVMGPEARGLVTARQLNLFAEWPLRQRYDAIFCRNVMIYFEEGPQEELELRFADLLKPGGYLYIGHSERLIGTANNYFERCGQTIYRRLAEG